MSNERAEMSNAAQQSFACSHHHAHPHHADVQLPSLMSPALLKCRFYILPFSGVCTIFSLRIVSTSLGILLTFLSEILNLF